MSAELVTIGNAAVIRDSAKPWRWLDAKGPNVTAWKFDPYQNIVASTTTMGGYTHTAMTTGNLTATSGIDGGGITITAGAGDNQGGQLQHLIEAFYFAQRWPAYFGISLAVNDADQTDFLVGLAITDTSAIDGLSDGIYFRSVDETAVVHGCTEKDNIESATAVGTAVDDAYILLEWQFDGAEVTFYVNGAEAGSTLYGSATFPNDEYLTPTLAFLTGEGTANTFTVRWAQAFQIREAV